MWYILLIKAIKIKVSASSGRESKHEPVLTTFKEGKFTVLQTGNLRYNYGMWDYNLGTPLLDYTSEQHVVFLLVFLLAEVLSVIDRYPMWGK